MLCSQAFRQVQELRKRLKQREQKAVEEADLVVQDKLIRTKQGKVRMLTHAHAHARALVSQAITISTSPC